jgi:hypothetical protein
MYLDNNIRHNIVFTVNLLVRYSVAPTMQEWNERCLTIFTWYTSSESFLSEKSGSEHLWLC